MPKQGASIFLKYTKTGGSLGGGTIYIYIYISPYTAVLMDNLDVCSFQSLRPEET